MLSTRHLPGTVALLLLGAGLATQPAAEPPAGVTAIDKRRLFNPTPSERAAEQRGRIYIYDGLHERDIDQAFETEFERIESMMFIRLQRDSPTGGTATQDDGC